MRTSPFNFEFIHRMDGDAWNLVAFSSATNNRGHGGGFSIAASPPFQSRACCGR